MARPPEMTILAEVSSGRSELARASPLKVERPGSSAEGAASTGATPPPVPVPAKAAVRTVTTFTGSFDCTVWMALPA